jgi:hypothetical protein
MYNRTEAAVDMQTLVVVVIVYGQKRQLQNNPRGFNVW